MNTIRSFFTATIVFLVVAIGGRVASSMDNIVWAWKCCPVDWLYDPKVRFCRPVGADGDEHDQRLMNRLGSEFRVESNAMLKSHTYKPPRCHNNDVLVDVPTEEVRMLMEADPPPIIDLQSNYCFDLTPSDELVARTCRPYDQYCGPDNYMCVRKCCPVDRLYDPKVQFCRLVGVDGDEHDQRLMDRLGSGFRVSSNATLKSYMFEPSRCYDTEVLVDVPTEEVRMLMEANPSPIGLPWNYCFDLTPSDELVARTCQPYDQYCGGGNYTCVRKCCDEGAIFVDESDYKLICKYSEIPFQLSAYETDVGGSPVGLSNKKVLMYSGGLSQCSFIIWIHNTVTLTTDGNLYINHEGVKWIIPKTNYGCVDYFAKDEKTEAADLMAIVCSKPPVSFLFWFKTLSVVFLVLTLIVYATLPYLRNAQGYYIMFYMACHLVYLVCIMIYSLVDDDIYSPLCIPFGYFMLFATLITCFWLNVICFDIYWMLRYNNSTNRNTSKSVRTIMYHIYCWGFPSICVSTGYFFQHSENVTLSNLAPDIGYLRCFFFDMHHNGTFIFYWLPSCGTLTVNLILFLLTAIHCSRIKSELNKFRRTDSKTEIFLFYKERFVMSIKLFLVFGIPFLFSLLCELFQFHWIMRMIVDSVHGLQGVFMFIIFVAKRNVIMDLRKKFRRSIVHSELTPLNNISGPS